VSRARRKDHGGDHGHGLDGLVTIIRIDFSILAAAIVEGSAQSRLLAWHGRELGLEPHLGGLRLAA
jgi:hypothetical protein